MIDGDNDYKDEIVLDRVDDSVVSNPHSVSVTPTQLRHAGGPRILGQERNRTTDPIVVTSIDLTQCSQCSGSEFDPIHQVQPRSILT